MTRHNIVSGGRARLIIDQVMDNPDSAVAIFESNDHQGIQVVSLARRCSMRRNGSWILTGGVVLEASAGGKRSSRRLRPGWTRRQAERTLSLCIAEMMAWSHEKRRVDEFQAWFERQGIPQDVLDDWCGPNTYETYISEFGWVNPEEHREYWRAKVRRYKEESDG